MDYEFIARIETWGSGGQMLDLITLKDGKILMITQDAAILYASRSAFDSGIDAMMLPTQER